MEHVKMDDNQFKVGDWLVHKDMVGVICCITQIHAPHYYLTDNYSFIKFGEEDNYRPWTIQDAKDGDVLVFESGVGLGNWYCIFKSLEDKESMTVHCYISMNGEFKIKKELCFDKDPSGVNPATKEQRDFLFAKMKEAGYEWDSEKKELKKREQKPILDVEIPFGAKDSELEEVTYDISKGYHAEIEDNKVVIKKGEQNPWSEEDEAIYYGVIETEQYMLDVVNGIKKFDVGNISIKEDCTRELNWLKSLKDRVQPQSKQCWSEEELDSITAAINNLEYLKNNYVYHQMGLEPAITFLKSLKDRYIWKPSDEQMKNLSRASNGGTYRTSLLIELYQDLKKL